MCRQTQHRRTHGSASWSLNGDRGPVRCVIQPKMTASESTPCDGECVSDESESADFEAILAREGQESIVQLQRALGEDVYLAEAEACVKEVRARMDVLLREIDKRRDGGDSQ